MKKGDDASVSGRRDVLKIASAGLLGAAVPGVAAAAGRGEDAPEEGDLTSREGSNNGPKPIYLYGCGWNKDLPGVFGEVCLTFDMRAELNGTGLGTFGDDVHPEINSQFEITSAKKQGNQYVFSGRIIASKDSSLVGMLVKIVAEKTG